MKKLNLKNLNEGELTKKLTELREEVRANRFKGEGARPKNVKLIQVERREIARILTALNKKNG